MSSSNGNAIEYLSSELPERRKRYTWAPRLYGLEIAHIDAIAGLVDWAGSHRDACEGGLADVINAFARAYGWSPSPAQSTTDSAHG
jgi:hypothetical protein